MTGALAQSVKARLVRHAHELGVDPKTIERTVAINAAEIDQYQEFVDAGADHLILMQGPPFPLADLERLLAVRG